MIHVLSLMVSRFRAASTVLVVSLMVAPAGVAQNAAAVIAGPPAPLPPEVINRGSFTTNLVGSRVTHMLTPLMFTSALVQYNSVAHSVSANVRLRWEYQPGSELFVVYNEQRDTLPAGFPLLSNRAFIVKISRLFRF
jgi:hypothetical protein